LAQLLRTAAMVQQDLPDEPTSPVPLEDQAAVCAHLLFRALVETDGDAALLHTGGTPQLVTPIGRIELVKYSLTVPAVERLLDRLLPDAAREKLQTSGVVQYDCPVRGDLPGEHFSVIAARLHHDVRLEVRRLRLPDDDSVPPDFFRPAGAAAEPQRDDNLALPSADELWPGQ
jgi:hypothetical protein